MGFFETTAFPWVVGEEGNLSMDPRDRGNWTGGQVGAGVLKGTKYGISAAAYPDLDIANLTLDAAQTLARSNYWVPLHCYDLPESVALCVFDFGYNAGAHEAIKVLQRALGVTEDGLYGQETHDAVWKQDPRLLVQNFTTARIAAYEQMPQWSIDGQGWRDRALATQSRALNI